MGNFDGNGEPMYEEISHRTVDKGFLEGATYAIGIGELDPDGED